MKKKLLTTAMLAALGGAGTAHAVYVNPDGHGQVLLYPYYTVQNEFVTSIHVTNTTSQTKAVKVRFLEGKNSQEVLDFNLYLSPEDMWTGVVVEHAGGGAKIITNDTSCTFGQIGANGQQFFNFEYQDDAAEFRSVQRTREGYVEIIEMGVLNPDVTPGSYAVHDATGVPADCALLNTADGNGTVDDTMSAPTGGLFGSGHLISVNGGVRTSYDAVALDDYFTTVQWSPRGSLLPSLAQVETTGVLSDGATQYTGIETTRGAGATIDRLSAILMKSAVDNEYSIDAGRESKTDWVITFPTKRFHVNTALIAPFNEAWNHTLAQSCDPVSFNYFDREEQSFTPDSFDFSPQPPGPDPFSLCNEVNTLTLYREGASADDSRLFGAEWTAADLEIRDGIEAGWMRIGFSGELPMTTDQGLRTFVGLPVIGFAAMSSVNTVSVVDEASGLNVFSAYMGSTVHKGEREINP